jgi:hypothetical protein
MGLAPAAVALVASALLASSAGAAFSPPTYHCNTTGPNSGCRIVAFGYEIYATTNSGKGGELCIGQNGLHVCRLNGGVLTLSSSGLKVTGALLNGALTGKGTLSFTNPGGTLSVSGFGQALGLDLSESGLKIQSPEGDYCITPSAPYFASCP